MQHHLKDYGYTQSNTMKCGESYTMVGQVRIETTMNHKLSRWRRKFTYMEQVKGNRSKGTRRLRIWNRSKGTGKREQVKGNRSKGTGSLRIWNRSKGTGKHRYQII